MVQGPLNQSLWNLKNKLTGHLDLQAKHFAGPDKILQVQIFKNSESKELYHIPLKLQEKYSSQNFKGKQVKEILSRQFVHSDNVGLGSVEISSN